MGIAVFASMLIAVAAELAGFCAPPGPAPVLGHEARAIEAAKQAWLGSKEFTTDQIRWHEPYRASLKDGVWTISGSSPAGWRGGNPGATLCQETGEVLTIFRWK